MAKWTAILLIVLVFAACSAAIAQDEGEAKVPVALTYEIYYPSSSETQFSFGNAWKGFGLSVLKPQQTEKWESLVSFNLMSSGGVNDANLYWANYGVQRGIGRENKKAQPFVVLGAGPYYGNIDAPLLSIDESKWGLNANASIGVLFNERFVVEARYDYFSRFAGFSFNGFTISAGVKLFDL